MKIRSLTSEFCEESIVNLPLGLPEAPQSFPGWLPGLLGSLGFRAPWGSPEFPGVPGAPWASPCLPGPSRPPPPEAENPQIVGPRLWEPSSEIDLTSAMNKTELLRAVGLSNVQLKRTSAVTFDFSWFFWGAMRSRF